MVHCDNATAPTPGTVVAVVPPTDERLRASGEGENVRTARSIGRWWVAAGAAVVLAGCSGPSLPEPPTVVTGIPASWVQRTTDGWPDSDGHDSSVPVLEDGDCLLTDDLPELLGRTAEVTDVGWGPYGDDSSSDTAFRYVCDLWAEDAYAGQLQLIKVDTAEEAQQTVDEFVEQPSTDVQDNTVATVRSGDLDVHVLSRWYPTNPQGEYQAMYFDQAARAVAVLEINSLDEDQYGKTSPQQVADALVASFR
jgi:hypothetical protein